MALTTNNKEYLNLGHKIGALVDVTFDSSYAIGGESFDWAAYYGLHVLDQIKIEDKGSYKLEYDRTNKKIKVMQPCNWPFIRYDEKHTAVSNSVTLDYPAAFIINVAKAGVNQKLRSTGIASGSLGTNECCLTSQMSAGVKTQITTKGATDVIYVTYVTQAWQDVWDNLVQDESITLSSSAAVDSAYAILALMYVDQITATAAGLTIVDEDDTAASGEVAVLFGNATGAFLTANAAQNAKVCKVTYIKKPASGFLADRAFSNETSSTTGADPYTDTFDYPILLWGYTGCAPVNAGVTQVLIDYAATPGAGEAVIDYFTPGARGAGAPATGTVVGVKSNVAVTGAGVWGHITEIPPRPFIEVPSGTDLSTTLANVKIMLIGN